MPETDTANAGLVDYGNAPEIFCDDLGAIQIIGSEIHWLAYRWRPMHGSYGPPFERVINLHVITPLSAIPSIAAQIVAAFACQLTSRVKSRLLELVR